MNDTMINNLFELYSNISAECSMSFITDAKRTVYHMIKEGKETDTRLSYLTAAIANLDWLKTMSVVDKKTDYSQRIKYANLLVSQYTDLCKDLLNNPATQTDAT